MPIPTFNIHISGNILAAYGAILSTITASVQIISHLKDRANLRIFVQHDMEMIGSPLFHGKTLTLVNVSNKGRRPVTITSVSAYRLHPAKAFIIPDTTPRIPCELADAGDI